MATSSYCSSCCGADVVSRELLVVLLAVFVLLAVSIANIATAVLVDEDDLRRWSELGWERQQCEVAALGISYIGDCPRNSTSRTRRIHNRPDFNYSECDIEASPECLGRAHQVFSQSRRLNTKPFNAHFCRDRFIPWAVVKLVSGARACGYRTGLPFIRAVNHIDEAEMVLSNFSAGQASTCWALTLSRSDLHFVHACQIVALESPHKWLSSSLAWIPKESERQKIWQWTYPVLAVVSVGILVLAPWCVTNRTTTSANASHRHGTPRRLSTLRNRWNLFSSGILAEYQAVNSARDCSIAPQPGSSA